MRQAGVVAAAGLFALEHVIPHLHKDHDKASQIAMCIESTPGLSVTHKVETNIVFFSVANGQAALMKTLCAQHNVLIGAYGDDICRVVTHLDVKGAGDVLRICEVIKKCAASVFKTRLVGPLSSTKTT